jgi:hypothetical protein
MGIANYVPEGRTRGFRKVEDGDQGHREALFLFATLSIRLASYPFRSDSRTTCRRPATRRFRKVEAGDQRHQGEELLSSWSPSDQTRELQASSACRVTNLTPHQLEADANRCASARRSGVPTSITSPSTAWLQSAQPRRNIRGKTSRPKSGDSPSIHSRTSGSST